VNIESRRICTLTRSLFLGITVIWSSSSAYGSGPSDWPMQTMSNFEPVETLSQMVNKYNANPVIELEDPWWVGSGQLRFRGFPQPIFHFRVGTDGRLYGIKGTRGGWVPLEVPKIFGLPATPQLLEYTPRPTSSHNFPGTNDSLLKPAGLTGDSVRCKGPQARAVAPTASHSSTGPRASVPSGRRSSCSVLFEAPSRPVISAAQLNQTATMTAITGMAMANQSMNFAPEDETDLILSATFNPLLWKDLANGGPRTAGNVIRGAVGREHDSALTRMDILRLCDRIDKRTQILSILSSPFLSGDQRFNRIKDLTPSLTDKEIRDRIWIFTTTGRNNF
jgi:hypothetical protein